METPHHYKLNPEEPRTQLRDNLVRALEAVAVQFSSTIMIEGIDATDLFGMNALLGGAIEAQTVTVLNRLRDIWDPDERYVEYAFKRYPESFPDVRLVSTDESQPIIGIELKGWYLLSKEAEPSFRFRASADAMTEFDLLVCYPWSLSNVLSGQPVLHTPFIEQGKYAADMRTYYWENRVGSSKGRSTEIVHPDTHPYPEPRAEFLDKPVVDGGNNFGRIARGPLMTEFVERTLEKPLAGIPARCWIQFLKLFAEGNSSEQIARGLERIANALHKARPKAQSQELETVLQHFQIILEYLGAE